MNYGRYLENDNGCEWSFGINDFYWGSGVTGVLVGLKIRRTSSDSRLPHKKLYSFALSDKEEKVRHRSSGGNTQIIVES